MGSGAWWSFRRVVGAAVVVVTAITSASAQTTHPVIAGCGEADDDQGDDMLTDRGDDEPGEPTNRRNFAPSVATPWAARFA